MPGHGFSPPNDLLGGIRQKVRRARSGPLFDGGRAVRELETAFESMWKRWIQGAAPKPFSVEGDARETSSQKLEWHLRIS